VVSKLSQNLSLGAFFDKFDFFSNGGAMGGDYIFWALNAAIALILFCPFLMKRNLRHWINDGDG